MQGPKAATQPWHRRDEDNGTTRIDGSGITSDTGVALMPEDIHSIQGKAENGGRLTLPLYGVTTDRQQGRVAYNQAESTYRLFPPGRENQTQP